MLIRYTHNEEVANSFLEYLLSEKLEILPDFCDRRA
jgi:hypothetical protein